MGARIAAKHVAGKLVKHDGQRQRAAIARFPRGQFSGRSLLPETEKATAHFVIEGAVLLVPAIPARLAPECENLSRGRLAGHARRPPRLRPPRLSSSRRAVRGAGFFRHWSWADRS